MDIKTVWSAFKGSSMKDKDMQKAFQRAATPNACIGLLEELEVLEQQLADLKASLPKVRADAVREAKKMTVLSLNTTNKDYLAGYDDGIEAYDKQLDMISEYMEAGNE